MQGDVKKKLDTYYSQYANRQVIVNLRVIKKIGLDFKKITFRCKNQHFPCILYSISMKSANIIAHLSPKDISLINDANKKISLRLSFISKSDKKVISFFVDSVVLGYKLYESGSDNIYMISMDFINQCPDDLISIAGRFFEEECSIEKRINERIVVSHQYKQGSNVQPSESFVAVGEQNYKCILTEISIFSAKVLIFGETSTFLMQDCKLIIKTIGLAELGELVGKIIRAEEVDKGKRLISLIIQFDQESVSPEYKMWVGEYIEFIALKLHKA